MKRIAFISMLCAGMLRVPGAEPTAAPQASAQDPKPAEASAVAETRMERTGLEPGTSTGIERGVVGQFLESRSLLAPINPLAKPEAGTGIANLSRDTVTGRVMGLRFIKISF